MLVCSMRSLFLWVSLFLVGLYDIAIATVGVLLDNVTLLKRGRTVFDNAKSKTAKGYKDVRSCQMSC